MLYNLLKLMIAGGMICGGIFSATAGGIALDGSMGTAGALTGPNFQIKAEYGRQAGTNLFHSFKTFNVQSHESATFSGPASVQHIISRVTGGEMSQIDGLLRSTISGADLLLINPAGVFIGPDASLNIDGAFYASAADYVRLGADRFFAIALENELLSVAAPTAFGFFEASPPIGAAENESRLVSISNLEIRSADQSIDNGGKQDSGRVIISGEHFYAQVAETSSGLESDSAVGKEGLMRKKDPCCPDDPNDIYSMDYPEDVVGSVNILIAFPMKFLDATQWLKTPCAARAGDSVSRFIVKGRDALPTALNDLQPGAPYWFE